MAKVDPRHVMALRRLTEEPISRCREALVEAGGDLTTAVLRFRESRPWVAPSDAEVAAVLAEYGVAFAPVKRQPRLLPDSEVVAELTFCGETVADFFLVWGLVCSVNDRGGLMIRRYDDEDLAASTKAYLRRMGRRNTRR